MLDKFILNTKSEKIDDTAFMIVGVEGYVDSSTFPQLQDHLQKLIDNGANWIIVDLGKLEYISSAGLGVLMGMLQEIRSRGGDLKLTNLSTKIQQLFDILGFSRLIRIYVDIEAATKALENDIKASADEEKTPVEDSY